CHAPEDHAFRVDDMPVTGDFACFRCVGGHGRTRLVGDVVSDCVSIARSHSIQVQGSHAWRVNLLQGTVQ
ncbi:MAG: hypothetical protein P8L16_12140, partial [Ilumatobacter sp.]|nr:hypothetical protein [Ilumatobacter sp.]